jgi:hypothetical protein
MGFHRRCDFHLICSVRVSANSKLPLKLTQIMFVTAWRLAGIGICLSTSSSGSSCTGAPPAPAVLVGADAGIVLAIHASVVGASAGPTGRGVMQGWSNVVGTNQALGSGAAVGSRGNVRLRVCLVPGHDMLSHARPRRPPHVLCGKMVPQFRQAADLKFN